MVKGNGHEIKTDRCEDYNNGRAHRYIKRGGHPVETA